MEMRGALKEGLLGKTLRDTLVRGPKKSNFTVEQSRLLEAPRRGGILGRLRGRKQ